VQPIWSQFSNQQAAFASLERKEDGDEMIGLKMVGMSRGWDILVWESPW
jgi:hypothetical protein